jgi:Mg-chelatase subunit ChlD
VAAAARRTISRRDLARHEGFARVSPEVGVIDPDALDSLLADDPDATLSLLADLNGATDERLRRLAHELSARVVVDIARSGASGRPGVDRLVRAPLDRREGDLDLDASLDAIVHGRRSGIAARPEELVVSSWSRRDVALCLLVDRSGSMHGERLATAAVTAAAVLLRGARDCSVVTFAGDAVVLAAQGEARPTGDVVVDLCRQRGSGVTDLGLALRVARDQLGRSRAARRVTVLLSDCRATSGGDPVDEAAGADELVVLAPGDDTADAEAFAAALGLRWAPLDTPSAAPEALERVLR